MRTLVRLKGSLYMKTAAHITKCAKVAPDVSPNSAGNHEASSASGQSSPFWSADGQPPACVYMIPQNTPPWPVSS